MSLIRAQINPLVLNETVTLRVADLYDFLTRKEQPMPDLNQATSVKKVKRGYRRVSMLLKLEEYNAIAGMAEQESRTPDQQAAYMLKRMLSELQVESIRGAYREAEDRRGAIAQELQPELQPDSWEEAMSGGGTPER